MPTWVLVQAPQGHAPVQPVFVNRLFHGPAGRTGTPFRVEPGFNTFSLRSGNAITAESVVDCPDALEANPFLVALAAMAATMAGAPPARGIAKKKAAKKVAKPKAKKAKAKKRTAARKAPKHKTTKRKTPKTAKPKAPRRKAARKTTTRRKRQS